MVIEYIHCCTHLETSLFGISIMVMLLFSLLLSYFAPQIRLKQIQFNSLSFLPNITCAGDTPVVDCGVTP